MTLREIKTGVAWSGYISNLGILMARKLGPKTSAGYQPAMGPRTGFRPADAASTFHLTAATYSERLRLKRHGFALLVGTPEPKTAKAFNLRPRAAQ